MQIPWQGLQGFTGASAVGALSLVGLTLIANAFAPNLFVAIDIYADTPTWAIIVAIPLVALTYLLGLLSNAVAQATFVKFGFLDGDALLHDIVALAYSGELITGRYHQLRQEAELLAGCFVALALLALGCGLSAWVAPGWLRFLGAVTLFSVVIAISSGLLAVSRHRAAHELALLLKRVEKGESTCSG